MEEGNNMNLIKNSGLCANHYKISVINERGI
jgi:hypothetical protein